MYRVAVVAQRWGLTVAAHRAVRCRDNEDLVRRAEAAGYTDLWSRRDQRARRLHAARPGRGLDRAGAARHRRRRRLRSGAGAARPGGGGARRRLAAVASRSASAPPRTGSSRAGTGCRSRSRSARCRRRIDFLRTALAGERADGGFKLERAPERAGADHPRGAARQDAAARGREGRRGLHQLPAPGGPAEGRPEQLEGAPEGFELLCRFFCIPGEREQVEPLARFMFSSYITVPVYEAFYRWLGYGEQIDEMVEAWNAKDRQKAAGGRALGADRGDVHLRLAGADAASGSAPSSRAASRCR